MTAAAIRSDLEDMPTAAQYSGRRALVAWLAATVLASVGVLFLTALASADGPAEEEAGATSILTQFPPLRTGVSMDRLDAVRRINDKHALAESLARQPDPGEREALELYTSRDPEEVARRLRLAYGSGNLLTRSAEGVAALARAAERGSQRPLDGVNALAAGLLAGGSELLGIEGVKLPKLRSKITKNEVKLRVTSKW